MIKFLVIITGAKLRLKFRYMLFDYFYYGNTCNHPMNVKETEDSWIIMFRATGLKKEDIKVSYDPSGVLVINSGDEKFDNLVRQEFRPDRFIDTRVQMPSGIDEKDIEAKVENGILEIRVGKDKDSGRFIEVK